MMRPPNSFQIYVPVRTEGHVIRDNGDDVIITCVNPAIARTVADLINRDAKP